MADENQVTAPEQVAGNEVQAVFDTQPGPVVPTAEAAPAQVTRHDSPGLDREPVRGEEARRPTPDPTVPKSPSRRLKVGDRYIINLPRKAPVGWATIKVLTNIPGHHVGVEFDNEIPATYATPLEGKADPKKGLWVHPQHLCTEEEHDVLRALGEAPTLAQQVAELEWDSETGTIKPVDTEIASGSPEATVTEASETAPITNISHPPAPGGESKQPTQEPPTEAAV